MPVYDCGDPDCDECRRAFGPDRNAALRRYEARELSVAVKAEREACAQTAERYCPFPSPSNRIVMEVTRSNIAAAIRNRTL